MQMLQKKIQKLFETILLLLSFSCDCAKSGFAIHFEWQLQIVMTLSISNGFP